MKQVAIIMGSDSDLPVMNEAGAILESFGIDYDISVVSAHRTPERLFSFSREAKDHGYKVIIAGAGGAAHLPGMVASDTASCYRSAGQIKRYGWTRFTSLHRADATRGASRERCCQRREKCRTARSSDTRN